MICTDILQFVRSAESLTITIGGYHREYRLFLLGTSCESNQEPSTTQRVESITLYPRQHGPRHQIVALGLVQDGVIHASFFQVVRGNDQRWELQTKQEWVPSADRRGRIRIDHNSQSKKFPRAYIEVIGPEGELVTTDTRCSRPGAYMVSDGNLICRYLAADPEVTLQTLQETAKRNATADELEEELRTQLSAAQTSLREARLRVSDLTRTLRDIRKWAHEGNNFLERADTLNRIVEECDNWLSREPNKTKTH